MSILSISISGAIQNETHAQHTPLTKSFFFFFLIIKIYLQVDPLSRISAICPKEIHGQQHVTTPVERNELYFLKEKLDYA